MSAEVVEQGRGRDRARHQHLPPELRRLPRSGRRGILRAGRRRGRAASACRSGATPSSAARRRSSTRARTRSSASSATTLITKTIHNGRGLMPAWGRGAEGGALLNDEQIHELAFDDPERRLGSRLQRGDRGLRRLPDLPAPAASSRRRRRPTPAAAATPGAGGEAGDVATSDQFTIESHDIFLHADRDRRSLRHRSDAFCCRTSGVTAHNFSIDALDISVDIAPGETKEVTIKAPEGEYEYYCNVPGHKEAGMVGTLIARPMASADAAGDGRRERRRGRSPGRAGSRRARRPAAATTQIVTSFDIYFEPKEVTIPANTDVTVHLCRTMGSRRTTSRSTSWTSAWTSRRARRNRSSSTPRREPTSTTATCRGTKKQGWSAS